MITSTIIDFPQPLKFGQIFNFELRNSYKTLHYRTKFLFPFIMLKISLFYKNYVKLNMIEIL